MTKEKIKIKDDFNVIKDQLLFVLENRTKPTVIFISFELGIAYVMKFMLY